MENKQKNEIIYRPLLFMIGTFAITWCCVWLMEKIDYYEYSALYTFLDFIENASPLFCAFLLLAKYSVKDKFLRKFFLGEADKKYFYVIVCILFIAQFLNFYLFRVKDTEFSIHTFMLTLVGQFLLGGGLEEAGWRGYLLPCFYKKYNVLISSVGVSVVWVFWHLPYFFIADSMQAGESFLFYTIVGIVTGFILTAIYLLTKSVLLCMLFHSWQNTIVMTVQADMGNMWFMLTFILLGVIAALLCLKKQKQGEIWNYMND